MARIPGIALLGVLLLAAACGAERGEDAVVLGTAPAVPSPDATVPAEPSPSVATSTPAAAATPVATSEVPPASTGAADLERRFAEAATLIEAAPTRVGVAVLTPDAVRHVGGDDGTFELASVVKLPIMLAALERARLEERDLTSQERRLLDLMVGASSNSATDELWRSLGEGPGVTAILGPLGVTSIEYAPDDQWGDSRASALEIVELLELVVSEQSVLHVDVRSAALELMQSVVADQRWGASAGVDLARDSGATLAIKNGWYPESAGWLLNSAAVITVAETADIPTVHVVVILTEGATTQTAGVRAIEEIAAAINHELVPSTLAVDPRSPTFAAATPADDEIENTETDIEAASLPEPDPTPPPVPLVAFSQSSDVLVPAGGALVGSDGTSSKLTLWYELPAAAANEMLASYATSMAQLGWLEVAGPPSVVLAKSSEDRWVGLSAHPATPGARLIEVTIAPAPRVLPAGRGGN